MVFYCATEVLADSRATAEGAEACESALASVSAETGIPLPLFRAIALAESGRRVQDGQTRPWPWSVNVEGHTRFFPSQDAMRAYVRSLLGQGITRFDVGCMQVHWHWHRTKVSSGERLLDPADNVRMAALLLLGHYKRTRSWAEAAGAYHSRNPEPMRRYLRRLHSFLEKDQG